MARRAGIVALQVDGEVLDVASSNVEFKPDTPEREGLVGPSGVQGFKEMPVVPFISGELRVRAGIDLESLQRTEDATVALSLPEGGQFVLNEAYAAGEWTRGTEEGTVAFRFEGNTSAFVPAP